MGNRAVHRWWGLLAVGALFLAGCAGTSEQTSSEGALGDGGLNEATELVDGSADRSDEPSSPTASRDGDEADGTTEASSSGADDDAAGTTTTTSSSPVETSTTLDSGLIGPPTNVTVTADGPDIVIRWGPSVTAGSDIEYVTHLRPVGETPDFRPPHYIHRSHLRVYRISNPPHGTYEVDVWAVRTERDGDEISTGVASSVVTRSVIINDRNDIEIELLAISDLLYNELNDREYLNLTLEVSKCVYLEVDGATTLRSAEFHRETCLSEVRSELNAVEPGTHSITLTLTDRDGRSITKTETFVVDGDRQPCQVAANPPDPWRVKSGDRTTLDLSLTGDCGSVDWRFSESEYPGFMLQGDVLIATPTGPARGELIQVGVAPAQSEFFGITVNAVVYTDEQPDVVPCGIDFDRLPLSNGQLMLRVAAGETVTSRIGITGDCDPYSWGQDPASVPGVSFQDGLLTVTGEGPPRVERFSVRLTPENGTRWALFVAVEFVE